MGDTIDPDKKSIAIRVVIHADDRTLSELELTSIHQTIILSVEKQFGATIRK